MKCQLAPGRHPLRRLRRCGRFEDEARAATIPGQYPSVGAFDSGRSWVLFFGGGVAKTLTPTSVRGAKGIVPRVSFLSSVGRSSYLAGRDCSGSRRDPRLALSDGEG